MLAEIWLEATSNFLDEKYYNHDALVGENACQIRAIILLNLASTFQKEKNEKLRETKKMLEQVINRLNMKDIDKP